MFSLEVTPADPVKHAHCRAATGDASLFSPAFCTGWTLLFLPTCLCAVPATRRLFAYLSYLLPGRKEHLKRGMAPVTPRVALLARFHNNAARPTSRHSWPATWHTRSTPIAVLPSHAAHTPPGVWHAARQDGNTWLAIMVLAFRGMRAGVCLPSHTFLPKRDGFASWF